MEKYSEMSNIDLKMCLEKYTQEFESKKTQLIQLCEDMDKIEKKYLKAKNELEIRKNLLD
jgi:hypothetical protein